MLVSFRHGFQPMATAISGGSAGRFRGDKEVTWIAAMGLGGQRIFVIPDLDLVVATTSGLYTSPRQGVAALDLLYRFVIPSVRDDNMR